MMIDPGNMNSAGAASTRNNRGSQAIGSSKSSTQPSASGAPASGEQVKLSAESQALARLEAKVNSLPDVDMDKVASIKAAIADGSFEVNVERLADRMMDADTLLG